MAEFWELILHHTYGGTPGVIFDRSPQRRSHGRAIGFPDEAFHADGEAPGSGCIDFAYGGRVVVPISAAWTPLLGVRVEVRCIRDEELDAGQSLLSTDTFNFGTSPDGNFRFSYSNGPYGMGAGGGTGPSPAPGRTIQVGEWTTLAWQYDGLFAHHFELNGNVISTFDGPLRPINPPQRINIGTHADGTGRWQGRIDDVKVWRVNPYRVDDEFTARPMDDDLKRCWAEWRRKLDQVMRTEPECGPQTVGLIEAAIAALFQALFDNNLHNRPDVVDLVARYRELWADGRLSDMPPVLADLQAAMFRAGIDIPNLPEVKALTDDGCAQRVLNGLGIDCDHEWADMMNSVLYLTTNP